MRQKAFVAAALAAAIAVPIAFDEAAAHRPRLQAGGFA